MSLVEIGQEVLKKVRLRVPQAQAEVFAVHSQSRTSQWSEGLPENRVISQLQGLCLRLVQEGRLGFGYTNHWDEPATEDLIQQVLAASRSTAPDPLLDVPEPMAAPADGDLELIDERLHKEPWESRCAFLDVLGSDVKKRDHRITRLVRGSYQESAGEAVVVNSRGIAASSVGTGVSFSLACVAEESGETQIGYAFQAARHYEDLKISWVVDRAVDRAVSLLGGKRIASGRYDLILDPFVAAEMLELFAGALKADQVQKGKSFLADKVGQRVGASCVNLVDHGRLPRSLGTSPFDAEGLPTQKTRLIEKGRLQGFLYDSYSARRGQTRSTGNAGRASYKSVPEPGPTNFYLEAGAASPEEMVASVRSGIYVRGVMGLHTVDTISGDYSLGIMGQRIENGVRSHAVRGITIAGNLLDLLQNVETVGADLTFSGSVGSPTLWIGNVSVGGN